MPYRDVGRIRKNKQKFIQEQTDIQAIKNSVRNILMIQKGTLPGDPEFGSRLSEVIFDPMDGVIKHLQETFIREQVQRYEPRVRITDVEFDEIPEYNRLNIKMNFDYLDKRTGEIISDNMSLPIDLI